MCVPILRSIGTKLTNLKNIQQSIFYLTSRDTKTVRLYDFRVKSYDSNSGFNVFDDFDLCSIGCHPGVATQGRNEVLKYPCEDHKNPSCING